MLDLAYCSVGERWGTRHGRLVLSMTRPCSVSSAAATCASAVLLSLRTPEDPRQAVEQLYNGKRDRLAGSELLGQYLEDIPIHLWHPQLEPDVGALPWLQQSHGSLDEYRRELLVSILFWAAHIRM